MDTDTIHPICVTDENVGPLTGEKVVVTGWGTLSSGGSMPDKLQEVEVGS